MLPQNRYLFLLTAISHVLIESLFGILMQKKERPRVLVRHLTHGDTALDVAVIVSCRLYCWIDKYNTDNFTHFALITFPGTRRTTIMIQS